MSKIDDVIRTRTNPPNVASAGIADIYIDYHGNLHGPEFTISKLSVPSLLRFLNEWYADPAPAQPTPATGWLCEATDKPGTRRSVVVLCQREYPTCAYFSDGKWWESSSKLRLHDVTHWQELPAMPTA